MATSPRDPNARDAFEVLAPAGAKILSIMPAVGWNCVWADTSGRLHARPLVCWALVSLPTGGGAGTPIYAPAIPGGTEAIVGIVATDLATTATPESDERFCGYSPSGDDIEKRWG